MKGTLEKIADIFFTKLLMGKAHGSAQAKICIACLIFSIIGIASIVMIAIIDNCFGVSEYIPDTIKDSTDIFNSLFFFFLLSCVLTTCFADILFLFYKNVIIIFDGSSSNWIQNSKFQTVVLYSDNKLHLLDQRGYSIIICNLSKWTDTTVQQFLEEFQKRGKEIRINNREPRHPQPAFENATDTPSTITARRRTMNNTVQNANQTNIVTDNNSPNNRNFKSDKEQDTEPKLHSGRRLDL